MDEERYILLDRDGVINFDSDKFIKSAEEWVPIPGSLEAIAMLNKCGYQVIVVSNQSGVARGLFNEQGLQAMHYKMEALLAKLGGKIKKIYYCPHAPDAGCFCRKPKPGLLDQFASEFNMSLANIPFVGDSYKDIQAALAVAAQPILVQTGKGLQTQNNNPDLNVPVFEDLYAVAKYILSR